MTLSRLLSSIGWSVLGLVLAVGCNPSCKVPCMGFDFCCRRPDVLASWEPCVLDYGDCFKDCCFQGNPLPIQQLTPDLYDPYVPIEPNYCLAKGDILEISIFGEKETDIDNALVAPDGKIYYTVLDGIQADGRTPTQVAEELAQKLDNLFINPHVTVVPKKTLSPTYRVLGRVRDPGEYSLSGPTTLREAIGESGGLISEIEKDVTENGYRLAIPNADLKNSFIVRKDRRLDIDFEKLFFTADPAQDIYLKPGDYIYIAGGEKREVFILGYANAPQRLPYYPGLTLMGALGAAGGWPTFSPFSPDLGNIIVIRGALTCPQVCHLDFYKIFRGEARDLYLQQGDIVYMTHKQWRTVRQLVNLAVDAFVNGFVVTMGGHYAQEHWFLQNRIDTDDTADD